MAGACDCPKAGEEAHVGSDDIYIALYQATQPGTAEVDYQLVGLNHFGIVVDDLDTQTGVQPHYEPDYQPGRRF